MLTSLNVKYANFMYVIYTDKKAMMRLNIRIEIHGKIEKTV